MEIQNPNPQVFEVKSSLSRDQLEQRQRNEQNPEFQD